MPAAAVIPAPVAYIKVVAVKKLVVGFLALNARLTSQECAALALGSSFWKAPLALTGQGV